MGELKLKPHTNVLALKIARAGQGEANGPVEAKAIGHRPGVNGHRPGATEAGLPLTPQRLELVKAYARQALRHAHAPTASQIAQRFAPRAEEASASGAPQPAHPAPLVAPLFALASGIRRLTTLVIVAALLPNLTLAAFWFGWVEPPWSRPLTASPELALPVLSAPATLEAMAGENVLLPIALDGTDGVPAGSVIVVRGLPPGSKLSIGRANGETAWTLRPDEIGDVHLVAAGGRIREAALTIELLAPNNGIMADAATVLKLSPRPGAAIAAEAAEAGPAEAQRAQLPAEEPETAAVTDSPPLPDEAGDTAAIVEPVPLPTRRPARGTEDVAANWVRPSAYVNLRDGPTSTARVVSVVAKGAKLRVVARKRGWVQVADPNTSQSGWIYSDYVETGP